MESKIHIHDVLALLNYTVVRRYPESIDINCPVCLGKKQSQDRNGHLNINLRKEVWRCNRCGSSGNAVDLYILFSNEPLTRQEAAAQICSRVSLLPRTPKPIQISAAPVQEQAPLEVRHIINSELLTRLKLSTHHRTALHNRGLSDEFIEWAGYRSLPPNGCDKIVRKMVQDGFVPERIPGFYLSERNQRRFMNYSGGILIPVRTADGLIQGFQIRTDANRPNQKRYYTISSVKYAGGSPASGYIHVIGRIRETMFLTEGALKSDVTYFLAGHSMIGMLGSNHWKTLKKLLLTLKKQGLKTVINALDMDQLVNPAVANASQQVRKIILECGLQAGTMIWNPIDKGIDDHYYHLRFNKDSNHIAWERLTYD